MGPKTHQVPFTYIQGKEGWNFEGETNKQGLHFSLFFFQKQTKIPTKFFRYSHDKGLWKNKSLERFFFNSWVAWTACFFSVLTPIVQGHEGPSWLKHRGLFISQRKRTKFSEKQPNQNSLFGSDRGLILNQIDGTFLFMMKLGFLLETNAKAGVQTGVFGT